MMFPYFPHSTRVVVSITVEGHQMQSITKTLTLTRDKHGDVCGQFADTVLSAMDLASAVSKAREEGR